MMTCSRSRFALLAGLAFVAALATRASAEVPQLERVRVLAAARLMADAELTDQHGQRAHLAGLRGKVAFVLFGFTNCPDVCPLAMERLRELYDSGALDPDDVAYVMISVDGERDTPAAMKDFLGEYGEGFLGLTAEPGRVKPVAAQFSAAFFKGHAGHGGGYDVAHSPQIFVLDTAGRLRAEIYGASVDVMARVATALLDEESGP